MVFFHQQNPPGSCFEELAEIEQAIMCNWFDQVVSRAGGKNWRSWVLRSQMKMTSFEKKMNKLGKI